MGKKPDLSIVILNYNAGKFLQQCLNSIINLFKFNNNNINIELIVVDNHSTDGSQEYLKKLKLKIIFNQKNLGFAAGNNLGVKASKGKYILFLNPDTIVFPGVIKTVFDFMKRNPRVGAATCRLELADGRLDEACHRGFPTPWRAFCHFSGLEKLFPRNKCFSGYTLGYLLNKKTAHEIDSCSGAFMMVRREVGDQVGWWDEDYFWYGEDIDFCYRIKQMGYKIYFLPQVKIVHYRGVTSGIKKHSQKFSQAKSETRIKAAKASTEAMRIFYRKHYLRRYPRIITALVFWAIAFLEIIRIAKIKLQFLNK